MGIDLTNRLTIDAPISVLESIHTELWSNRTETYPDQGFTVKYTPQDNYDNRFGLLRGWVSEDVMVDPFDRDAGKLSIWIPSKKDGIVTAGGWLHNFIKNNTDISCAYVTEYCWDYSEVCFHYVDCSKMAQGPDDEGDDGWFEACSEAQEHYGGQSFEAIEYCVEECADWMPKWVIDLFKRDLAGLKEEAGIGPCPTISQLAGRSV
mgnify:FL=1